MLCDICHEFEATVFYTIIVNNQKTELHLCEKCATKKGLIKSPGSLSLKEFMPLIPHELETEDIRCPLCGLSYKEFRETTKFGCPECYTAFEKKIIPLLRRIHGSVQHIGKTVEKSIKNQKFMDNKMHELRGRLKEAIEAEQYEEAARIRDEMKKMQNTK